MCTEIPLAGCWVGVYSSPFIDSLGGETKSIERETFSAEMTKIAKQANFVVAVLCLKKAILGWRRTSSSVLVVSAIS